MGNCVFRNDEHIHPEKVKTQPKWGSLLGDEEARKKYTLDNSIPQNCSLSFLRLRLFLDDPELVNALATYAKRTIFDFETTYILFSDICLYKTIDSDCVEYARSRAVHIFRQIQKYDAEEVANIKVVMAHRNEYLSTNLFDKILHECIERIHSNVYLDFKLTPEFAVAINALKQCGVVVGDDFDYMGELGNGCYGVVVLARKKSTGVRYAMKVQTKLGLLQCFKKSESRRVMDERNALIVCSHPFIIALEYAFQTETLVTMVMELGTVGSLHDECNSCFHFKMSLARVRFYMAEVVLALNHIHKLGYIYRDLKPSNIVLALNGHVKLIDLGGIVDPRGKLCHNRPVASLFNINSIFNDSFDSVSGRSARSQEYSSNRYSKSVMGTDGFMAPEMRRGGDGYSKTTDFWSVGVTMFELLFARNPFEKEVADDVGTCISDSESKSSAGSLPEEIIRQVNRSQYVIYFNQSDKIVISPNTIDLISRFLMFDSSKRLGSGATGVVQIKSHPFFKDIDWELLEQVRIVPPYLPPQVYHHNEIPLFDNFDDTMAYFARKHNWNLSKVGHAVFDAWNYISPAAVKKEIFFNAVLDGNVTDVIH